MKKLAYYLDMSEACRGALTGIAERIPCFIWEENDLIVIECREDDAAFVERILAPYV